MTEEIVEYELGDVTLESGETLKSAVLVAKTWGQLSVARDNVIVLPTYSTTPMCTRLKLTCADSA